MVDARPPLSRAAPGSPRGRRRHFPMAARDAGEKGMKRTRARMRSVVAALIVWAGFGSLPVLAQQWELGLDVLFGLPQNEFRDKIRDEGFGGSGRIGRFLGDWPVMVGGDIGYINYGTEERWEPVSASIPDVYVLIRTTNNILLLHGFARIQAQEGRFRPYFEGLVGFKYLFTSTSIEDEWSYEPIASMTNLDDLAGSRGLGAGIDLRLWEGPKRIGGDGVYDLSLNLGAKYLWGSEAQYLKEGSIIRNPEGRVSYDVLRSATTMLLPSVGLRIRF